MYTGYEQDNRRWSLDRALEYTRHVGRQGQSVNVLVEEADAIYNYITGADKDQPVNGSAEPDVEAEDDLDWEVTHHGPFIMELDDISQLPEKLGDIFKLIQQERQFQEDAETVEDEKEEFIFPGPIFNTAIHDSPVTLPTFLQKFAGNLADALEKKIQEREDRERSGGGN